MNVRLPTATALEVEDRSDVRLVERCRARDAAAWEALYRRFARPIAVYLRRLVGPIPEVDDLLQEVFVVVIRSLPEYRGESSFSGWIYGIATHVAQRHLRWRFRWFRRRHDFQWWVDTTPREHADVAEGAEARAALSILAGALDRMGHRHRAVWVLREWEGLSSEEVAQSLSIPVGTVRSRLFQARKAIAEALAEAGVEGGVVSGPAEGRLGPPADRPAGGG